MSEPNDHRLSADEAAALWRRAAQLQADAVRRLDERSRQIAREGATADSSHDGIGVSEVRAIAAEVGIAPEYMQQAMAEREIARSRGRSISPAADRWATRLLGDEQQTVNVSRRIGAEPDAVFQGMRRVFRSAAYDLTLVDTLGADPLQGATLVFGVPVPTSMEQRFAYTMYSSGLKELMVSLDAAADGTACEVRVRSDLQHARKTSLAFGIGSVGTIAAGGGTAGTVMSSVLLATSGAALAVPAVLAGGLLAGAAVIGNRAVYRWGIHKGVAALEELLRVLDVDVRTDGAFALPTSRDANRGSVAQDALKF